MNSADPLATYRAEYAVFARRRSWARATQIVMITLGVVLLAIGLALTLGAGASSVNMNGNFLAQRHIPGPDGSISLPEETQYALINEDGDELTACTITPRQGGEPLEQTPREGHGMNFDAAMGQYIVECADNPDNAGVAVFREKDMIIVENDIYVPQLVQGLAFLGIAIALMIGSKFAARRIAPESLRPDIPA